MKSLLPPELQPAWSIRDTKTRRERLAELAFAGYRIPRCGVFQDMRRLGVPLVVYADDSAHCGEGKVLWHEGQPGTYDNLFCTEYVPDFYCHGGIAYATVSRRLLVVGDCMFRLKYTSYHSWQSNVDGDFEVVYGPHAIGRAKDLLPYPMYAIDYTRYVDGDCGEQAYHFDLNVCPFVPLEVVNLVGRDVLTESVAKFCRERGLIS